MEILTYKSAAEQKSYLGDCVAGRERWTGGELSLPREPQKGDACQFARRKLSMGSGGTRCNKNTA